MSLYLANLKIQTNCNVTKDRKIKGKLIRSKQKVEPEYIFLKDMVIDSLDLASLNKSHIYRIYRDLKYSSDKIKSCVQKSTVQIVSVQVTKDKLGLVG